MAEEEEEVVVIAKCVGCGSTREIRAGEVCEGEQPMCKACSMPMVAKEAKHGQQPQS